MIIDGSNDTLRGDFFATIPEAVLYADIGANAVRLYSVLNRRLGTNDYAWPSHAYLAGKMRCSVNTVKASIKELVGIGALTVQHRSSEAGHQTSSAYYLHGGLVNVETLARQKLTVGQKLPRGGSKIAYEREPVIESQETPLFNEVERPSSKPPYSDQFEAVWAIYPKKRLKADAYKSFVARVRAGVPFSTLIEATENYAAIRAGQDQQFSVDGKRFFGPDYWKDYLNASPELANLHRTKDQVNEQVEQTWRDLQTTFATQSPTSPAIAQLLENFTLKQLGRMPEREVREIIRQSVLGGQS